MLALIFVAFFGGILVTIARFNASEVRKTEASVAGWEMVELAKAARLYMRDQYAVNPAIRTTAATPNIIPYSALLSGGYLPSNFGSRTDAGGNPINALNQRVYVIMTNWSPTGIGGDVTNPATVPSAFVYFAPGGKASNDLMVDIVSAIRQQNVALTAPLWDTTNTNRSADCRGGGPAVALWDTGCMPPGEFATLVGPLGLSTTFAPGGLLMPAWKAVQPDLRAVLRYPQPENPGYATMLTDLGMGTPTGDCTVDANQVHITTTDATGNIIQTSTNVCDALSDTVTADMRFNIDHVGNFMAQRLVAMPQAQDYGVESANIGTANDDSMRVNGDVNLGSDLRIYNTKDLPAGVPARYDVPNGTVVIERNIYTYSKLVSQKGHAKIGTIATAQSLVSDNLSSNVFKSLTTSNNPDGSTSAPQMNVTSHTDLTGHLQVSPTTDPTVPSELITDTMNGANAEVHVTDTTGTQAQITGTLDAHNSTVSVTGANPAAAVGGYTAVTGEISNAGTVNVTSAEAGGSDADLQFLAPGGAASVTAGQTADANLTGQLPVINATTRCLEGVNVADACANRQFVPPNITP